MLPLILEVPEQISQTFNHKQSSTVMQTCLTLLTFLGRQLPYLHKDFATVTVVQHQINTLKSLIFHPIDQLKDCHKLLYLEK